MDAVAADLALQAILGRGDFVGGIDNEALDFSQLEAFINSEGPPGSNGYFTESLNATATAASTGGKLLNVIVENKRPGHSLPDSPPDSGSEHPYSPSETCEQPLNSQETIYTTLGPGLYKTAANGGVGAGAGGGLASASAAGFIGEGLILGHSIVTVAGQQLQDGQLQLESGPMTDGRIILQDSPSARQILVQTGPDSAGQSFVTDNVTSRPNSNPNVIRMPDIDYDKSHLVHLGYNPTGLESLTPQRATTIDPNAAAAILEPTMDNMQAVYTNLQNVPKKRKLSQDVALVKSEPELVITCPTGQLSPPTQQGIDDDYAASETCLSDSQYQCIRFQPFQQSSWHVLCDQNLTELPPPHYRVDADKGFNFSNADDAFVCQKKNHFQITCHVQLLGDAQFVKTPEGLQKISSFHLHFYGVKHDCPTQTIRVEQSQSDRSKKPFHPVLVELVNSQVTKITVGRLHFSETTSNNMRKKGKPNPEQRYFQLVVGLHAHTAHGNFPIASHASQRIIVRASNPGQFESDVEMIWQKGHVQESIFHTGKVGINTDKPDESLVVHGNIKITGHIIQPSDIRFKKNIVECNTAEQLKNVQKLRVVRYEYDPSLAAKLNRSGDLKDTGVIAQEVAQILPEAVQPAGDLILENGVEIDNFLVVNKERIFMENIGAVKELCKVTDNLETRIDHLERINRRLNKLKRGDSFSSTLTSTKRPHSCKMNTSELCSNKFIQIVIVVLVLIMAFCLAAITTLYLLEMAKHSQAAMHARFQAIQNSYALQNTKRPSSSSSSKSAAKNRLRLDDTLHATTRSSYRDRAGSGGGGEHGSHQKQMLDPSHLTPKLPYVLGRPPYCGDIDSVSANLCQTYCCIPPALENSEVIDAGIFSTSNSNANGGGSAGDGGNQEQQQPPPQQQTQQQQPQQKSSNGPVNKTAAAALLNLDKSKIVKPFNTNNIDKLLPRQKRDSDDIYDNIYDNIESQPFVVVIEGRTFNTTLGNEFLLSASLSNLTYIVPVSKYMSDDFVQVTFKSSITNVHVLEHCYNDYKQQECPLIPYWEDNKAQRVQKVNEDLASINIGTTYNSATFQVDMVGFLNKFMTYRASLIQNKNSCLLPPSKVGIEYVEYNFNFYRTCDE